MNFTRNSYYSYVRKSSRDATTAHTPLQLSVCWPRANCFFLCKSGIQQLLVKVLFFIHKLTFVRVRNISWKALLLSFTVLLMRELCYSFSYSRFALTLIANLFSNTLTPREVVFNFVQHHKAKQSHDSHTCGKIWQKHQNQRISFIKIPLLNWFNKNNNNIWEILEQTQCERVMFLLFFLF